MNYTTHIAVQGQRWDMVAFLAYGDALRYAPIVVANPQYRALKTFNGGERLRVPVITKKAVLVGAPPWRR